MSPFARISLDPTEVRLCRRSHRRRGAGAGLVRDLAPRPRPKTWAKHGIEVGEHGNASPEAAVERIIEAAPFPLDLPPRNRPLGIPRTSSCPKPYDRLLSQRPPTAEERVPPGFPVRGSTIFCPCKPRRVVLELVGMSIAPKRATHLVLSATVRHGFSEEVARAALKSIPRSQTSPAPRANRRPCRRVGRCDLATRVLERERRSRAAAQCRAPSRRPPRRRTLEAKRLGYGGGRSGPVKSMLSP